MSPITINENANGLIRQYFPKGTNFKDITNKNIALVVKKMNLPAASRRGIKMEKVFFNIGETRCFSPNPSSACLPHRKRWGIKKHNKS